MLNALDNLFSINVVWRCLDVHLNSLRLQHTPAKPIVQVKGVYIGQQLRRSIAPTTTKNCQMIQWFLLVGIGSSGAPFFQCSRWSPEKISSSEFIRWPLDDHTTLFFSIPSTYSSNVYVFSTVGSFDDLLIHWSSYSLQTLTKSIHLTCTILTKVPLG